VFGILYYFAPWLPRKGVKYCDQCVCMSFLSACISQKSHGQASWNFLCISQSHGSVFLWQHCNMLCTSGFLDDIMFSDNGAYVVYSKAYGQGMSVSRRQCRERLSFSTSAPSLIELPPTDWHPSAVSLIIHNRVWLWRWTVRCARWQSLLSSISLSLEWKWCTGISTWISLLCH